MPDAKKIINGLEMSYKYSNVDEENTLVPQEIVLHAIALLKAQEPRVMTYDEMMKAEICFLEVKGIEEIDPFIRYEVDDKSYWSSPYTNNEDNPFELLAEQEEYLINARCWTSRPTDEQRKAVKWDA